MPHLNFFLSGYFLFGCQENFQRGNQRERDRERAKARAGNKEKQAKHDGLTPEQRRERDAKALQEKAARKAAQAAGGINAGGVKDVQIRHLQHVQNSVQLVF
ncbi:small EDRK-rich factor 2-like [Quillaja saponaria]|uniref:Small EDRK-rich factor 2-like n=1 Tax=Quillaja saponaria TaxID=32244 RepID=A0AAD7LNZ5_QUISA|nr:small EDRK-rich factor 2-like [Quillaja saponaria]